MVNDPYKVLGISKDATEDEIKRAYRKKAKECHPDLHPDDPKAQEKMNEVNEAYDMLKNPEKYRQQAFSSQNGYSNPYSSYQQYGQTYTYTNFYDFFQEFASQQQSATIPMPNYEAGDREEIRQSIRWIREQQYSQANRILSNISSFYRDARWYYLYALTWYGMGYRTRAFEAIQKSVQMDSTRQDYRYVYDRLKPQQNSYSYQQGPFMYRQTTFRRGHSIFYYFIIAQLILWLLRALLGGFGMMNSNRGQDLNSNYETPSTQFQRNEQEIRYD